MKHILSLDIQETKDGYTFTIHNDKKVTTFKNKGILEGFEKAKEIILKVKEGK